MNEFEGVAGKSLAFLGAWEKSGAVKVRRFLEPDRTAALSSLVHDCYRELAGALSDGQTLDVDLVSNFRTWNGIAASPLGAFLSRRRPTLASQWDDAVAGITDNVRRLFGPRWYFCPERSFFRKHIDVQKFVPWHTDADAAEILGARAFNVWLPLDPVGVTAPSLDFMCGSHHTMRASPPMKGADYIRSDEWVTSQFGIEHWCPSADPGDAIIFDQHILHRTQRGCGSARTSCEFRFEAGLLRQLFVWPARRANRVVRSMAKRASAPSLWL